MTAPDPAAFLSVRGLHKDYPGRGRGEPPVRAVVDVDLDVHPGETLALVGESGCGKTTVGKCVTRLTSVTSGEVVLDGTDIARAGERQLRAARGLIQYVFQDPYAALNPTLTIGQSMAEPLVARGRRGSAVKERALHLMERVGLRPEHLDRYPHQFSGGQRQRIVIARALMLEPRMLVLDEPVSALDVSIQAQILNLLSDLQQELGLAYLFISHDLSVVSHVADRVAVMYLGLIVESGTCRQLTADPQHPYSRSLLSAVPTEPGDTPRERIVLRGELPSPSAAPAGCRFHTRCFKAAAECAETPPALTEQHDRLVACFRVDAPEGADGATDAADAGPVDGPRAR